MSHATLQGFPVGLAAFAAAFVEFVEALTVVLAVGTTRGWRCALAGSGAACLVLVVAVLLAGPLLTLLPLAAIQVVIGMLLLLFGLRWLRKAILRAAGVLPLHDEAATYVAERERLGGSRVQGGWDGVGLTAAFQITLLEGLEVVFIVVAFGAGRADLLVAASFGAGAALLAVIALGLVLHRPLARVPENALKFVVGVLLCAFGTFWVGEGTRLAWPGGDLSLVGLCAGFLAVAFAAIPLTRARARQLGPAHGRAP